MSADSIVFALMTSLSDLSITQEEIQAEISAGFIEGDSIGSQDSGVSWHPSSDGHSSLSHTLTQRCLDGTHSILFEKAPGAGSLQSVGISPLELVHLDNRQCTPAEMETSSMVFTPVEAPDSELPVLGYTNLLFTDKTSADIIADLQKILEAKAATGISDGEQASALRTQRLSRMQSSAASRELLPHLGRNPALLRGFYV